MIEKNAPLTLLKAGGSTEQILRPLLYLESLALTGKGKKDSSNPLNGQPRMQESIK